MNLLSLTPAALLVAAALAAPSAFAQSNYPGKAAMPKAGITKATTSGFTTTATQTIAATGACTQVTVYFKGQVTGVNAVSGGDDVVSLEVWDDGELKVRQLVTVPVGTTIAVDTSLTFQGLYATGAPGVAAVVTDSQSLDDIYSQDPLIPTDIVGDCGAPNPIPASVSPVPVFELPALLGTIGAVGFAAVLRQRRRKTKSGTDNN